MRKKWLLSAGREFFVVVPLADLFPPEMTTVDAGLLVAHLDKWMAEPTSRQVVLNMYESVNARVMSSIGQADEVVLRRSVQPRIEEAFRRRELVALQVRERSSLRQTGEEAAATPPAQAAARAQTNRQDSWVEIKLVDMKGQPVGGEKYRIKLPNGTSAEGRLNEHGEAEYYDIDAGNCEITFPDLDGEAWEPA